MFENRAEFSLPGFKLFRIPFSVENGGNKNRIQLFLIPVNYNIREFSNWGKVQVIVIFFRVKFRVYRY